MFHFYQSLKAFMAGLARALLYILVMCDTDSIRQRRCKMKHKTLAFIIALGLAVPGLAYATDSTAQGNTAYEHDFADWNDDGGINAARLAAQKLHFEYNNIYEHDVAVWNDAGHGGNAARLAS